MFSKIRPTIYVIALSLMASFEVSAELATNQMIETDVSPTDSYDIYKSINASIGFGYESDFYEYNAANKEQSLNLQLEITLKHNDWKYGVNTLVSKKLEKEEKSEFGDSKIFAFRSLNLFSPESSFTSSLTLSVSLPTSEYSRYEREMYANLAAGPTIAWKKESFNLFLIPRLGKVFSKYKTTFSGEANTSYYSKMSLAPTYQITDYLTTQFITSVTQAWTENHSRKPPTYSSELNTELRLDTNLSLGLAIANEDKIYKSNGTSSNLKIFDRNLSVYSLTVTKDF